MSYAQRLLENCEPRLLENGTVRGLELYNPQQVCVGYPKLAYCWTDRTGITTPDVTGPLSTTGLVITGTAQAGTLVITADGTAMSASIGIAVVLWDERGNPDFSQSGMLTLSGWCKNAAGNYIAANG